MSTLTFNTWLDEHTGPVFKYAMRFRPAQCGFTCPRDGYLLCLESDPIRRHPDFPHGLVFYSRELTADEIASFQLAKI